jgi:phage terminase large subunit-like protein
MVEDLRERYIQKSEEVELEEVQQAQRPFLGLEPWQRFVLALLLFLDVAVIGLMVLAMAGRLPLPF